MTAQLPSNRKLLIKKYRCLGFLGLLGLFRNDIVERFDSQITFSQLLHLFIDIINEFVTLSASLSESSLFGYTIDDITGIVKLFNDSN